MILLRVSPCRNCKEIQVLGTELIGAVYGNEESVGRAIRESGLNRSELYISTKWGVLPDGGDIQVSIRESLTKVSAVSPL